MTGFALRHSTCRLAHTAAHQVTHTPGRSLGCRAAPGQDAQVPLGPNLGGSPADCTPWNAEGQPSGRAPPSSGATALLQGKKQWADSGRPDHTIPAPEPGHLHPTCHPSLPFQPHGHHLVVATITFFLVMTSASTIHALGPVSHTPARASCPEEKLHSIPPALPSLPRPFS